MSVCCFGSQRVQPAEVLNELTDRPRDSTSSRGIRITTNPNKSETAGSESVDSVICRLTFFLRNLIAFIFDGEFFGGVRKGVHPP